ncbi:tetratricopeptide repeat protein [Variovorax defluvii]|uniref:type III secretion apparatus assembly chaperone SctY n=1 Tax=Variovorax defluvii TaxID=913761 RepID=UPI0031EA7B4C
MLSQLYLRHGRQDSALALLRALCALEPGDRRASLALAYAATRAGQPRESERVIDRMRDEGEPSPVLDLLQGQALAAQGRHGEAEQAFETFIARRADEQRMSRDAR